MGRTKGATAIRYKYVLKERTTDDFGQTHLIDRAYYKTMSEVIQLFGYIPKSIRHPPKFPKGPPPKYELYKLDKPIYVPPFVDEPFEPFRPTSTIAEFSDEVEKECV